MAQNVNTQLTKIFAGLPGGGFPFSFAELAKELGKGPLRGFLLPQATRDVVYFKDDFTGRAIDTTNNWAVANGGGASVASFATNVQANGVVRATTGTANGATASASLVGPIQWLPSTSPGMEVRFKVITSALAIRAEFGFIDAVPASNTSAFNNMDTPTFFSANSVTAGWDTAATATNINLMTIGSASNQAAKRVSGATAPAAINVYQTIRIQIFSRDDTTANAADAALWVDGVRVASADTSATAGVGVVNASVLLGLWAYIEATSATSKSLDIDYIECWSQRIT